MLEAQNYHVDEEVRKTGSELDLLCKHNVSKKKFMLNVKPIGIKRLMRR